MRVRKIAAVVAALSLGLIGVATVQAQSPGQALHLKTRLGDRVPGQLAPGGKAHWVGTREDGRGISVSVAGLELAAGTTMNVTACGASVGSLQLRPGRNDGHTAGRLRLSVRRGDAVPNCKPGDEVVVVGGGLTLRGALQPGRGRQ